MPLVPMAQCGLVLLRRSFKSVYCVCQNSLAVERDFLEEHEVPGQWGRALSWRRAR